MTFWVAGAIVGSAVIGSVSADNAVDAQSASTAEGIAEQRRQFDLTRQDFAPYRAAGTAALGQLQSDINKPTTAADVMSEPGYQFGMDQGQQAIDRKIAAMGGRVSGAAIKAAGRFGTNYAASGYGAAYQRRQDRLNRLAAIAGIGQTSTGASAAAGSRAADNISGMITSQGDATAAGRISQGNIWGNTANQLVSLYGRRPVSSVPSYYEGLGGGAGNYNWGGGN